MVDVAHIIPPSPDDPPRRPSPVRPWHAAVALAVAAVVGGGLLVWKPWQSVTLPEHACWSVLGKDDLKPIAGPDGTVREPVPSEHIATPTKSENASTRSSCIVWREKGYLLDIDIKPAWAGIDADRAEDARAGKVTPLDLGAGAVGWVGVSDENRRQTARLYVRCDFEMRSDYGRPAPQYFDVRVTGDVVDGTSPARVRQAYADIALKVGRAAATAYECRNTAQLPVAAPRVPS
ncbi:hypothetical protein ACFQ6N_28510 [Kitasatospora sp. NPDC056446]|uniref:hypothetical protein n=1 Tax=Kitasatospora sp. NPDC056446 TaxID=3345819 RepID=UPI0036AB8F0B